MDGLFSVVVRPSKSKNDCPQQRKTLLETWIPEAYFCIGTTRQEIRRQETSTRTSATRTHCDSLGILCFRELFVIHDERNHTRSTTVPEMTGQMTSTGA